MSRCSSRPTLSVIVPCYNSAQWVNDCFESIAGQKHLSLEIIFINDFSGDNTLKKLQTIQQTHKSQNITVIDNNKRIGNLGVSLCRNKGSKVAKGRYLMFVDSDDTIGYKNNGYDPYYLEAFYRLMDTFPNTGMVVGQLHKTTAIEKPTVSNELFKAIGKRRSNSNSQKRALKTIKYLNERVSACATIYRTDFIKENKIYFDKNFLYFEDAKFVTDYAIQAYNVFDHIARPNSEFVNYMGGVYLYNIHNDSAMAKVQMKHSEQIFRHPERIRNWIIYLCGLLINTANTMGTESELFHFLAKTKFAKEIPATINHYAALCENRNHPLYNTIISMKDKIPYECQKCKVNYLLPNKIAKTNSQVNNCAQCTNSKKLIEYIITNTTNLTAR